MAFPIRKCKICGDEFELKPGKPGLAIHCPNCSETEAASDAKQRLSADERRAENERNAARRGAMRDLLYRKDS